MKPAILAGSVKLPIESIDAAEVKKALTFACQPMGSDEPTLVLSYAEDEDYLCVPRQYGIDFCKSRGIPYEDHTSMGLPAKFPTTPKPRDYQVEVLRDVGECYDSYYDFIFRARTGWGKTIGALITAARLGVSTLILVDQNNLKDQWVDALVKHFGFAVEDIGVVQGKKCTYEGKAVTVAMVQTLSQKSFPAGLYDAFGLVIVDEVHIIGAPTFGKILLQLNAAYRMGVSATPKRRDGLQKTLDYNLGKVRVYVDDEHEESSVYVRENPTVYSWYANTSPKMGRFITEVAEDAARNLLIAESIEHLHSTGRDTLVLSDRIEHLKGLMSLCYYMGIPEEEMGLYTGYNPVYGYEKDPAPKKRPEGWVKGAEYTPVSLNTISKRTKKAEFARIKESAKVIFATYGMFSKGVDVPRLTGGVDATPRSQSEQVQGRILRKLEGKKRPIWVTITDPNSYRSQYSLHSRLADYAKNNSEIYLWGLDGVQTKCNPDDLRRTLMQRIKTLKSLRIETDSDGLNTLETRAQQMRNVIQRASDTKLVTRRRPPG